MKMTTSRLITLLISLILTTGLVACAPPPASETAPSIRVFFNHTGSIQGNNQDILPDEALVERIDSARSIINAGIYGFSNRKILDALIRAHMRGVKVRIAGDARHFSSNERGYRLVQQHHIPLQVGNEYHIMHDKMFIIDNLFVFAGTGNITTSGFERNDNNWVLIEHPGVAQRFNAEFEQMFAGKFSTDKDRQAVDLPNTWKVGDTTVEVYFSPEDDTMGRILEELEKTHTNIYFTIFAFTKDQIGSTFIAKHREFLESLTKDEKKLPAFSDDPNVPARPKVVTGIMDRSQVQGNFLYHEIYRLISNGVPLMIDANENSFLPGDYQAGGGRLHSKTMILDRGTDDARVITGSFNWSSAATIANDEFLLILRGKEITEQYYQTYEHLWRKSKDASVAVCNYYDRTKESAIPVCAPEVGYQDVVISEVHWAGWNGLIDQSDRSGRHRKEIADDEYFELYNRTDKPIDLSLWTLSNDSDFKMGFTPGTVIPPKSYFLIADHNTPQSSDTESLDFEEVSLIDPDFVINSSNDPRFPRLNFTDEKMELYLYSPTGLIIDTAGDGGLPFAGQIVYEKSGPKTWKVVQVKSMERKIGPDGSVGRGHEAESWYTSEPSQNNTRIAGPFRDKIIGTPGEPNSPQP